MRMVWSCEVKLDTSCLFEISMALNVDTRHISAEKVIITQLIPQ
jgi:hypothetical protein